MMKIALIVLSLAFLAGCDNFNWEPCGLGLVKCKTTDQPLFHGDASDDRTLKVHARASLRPSFNARTKPQLWLVDGGPGAAASDSFTELLPQIQFIPGLGKFDVFSFDHRGVGESSPIKCEENQSLLECIDSHDTDLNAYTTDQAAHDLAALIKDSRYETQPVYLLGGSYGSYLIQRFAQLYPDVADGIVLLETVSPQLDFSAFDASFNNVALDFFETCNSNALCSGKLGLDLDVYASQVLSSLEDGHCQAAELSAGELKVTMAILLYASSTRELIPAILYRLQRCNEGDIVAIRDYLNPRLARPTPEGYSEALQYHIALSELWNYDAPPTESDMQEVFDDSLVSLGVGIDFAENYDSWPVYQRSAFDGEYMDYTGPLLMLHGGLDPASPYDAISDYASRYNAPNQTLVLFPEAGHDTLFGTRIPGETLSCGIQLISQFLQDSSSAIDTSCVATVESIDFIVAEEVSESYLGTTNIWGD